MKKVILIAAAVALLSSGVAQAKDFGQAKNIGQAKIPSAGNAADSICFDIWGVDGCVNWIEAMPKNGKFKQPVKDFINPKLIMPGNNGKFIKPKK